MRSPGAGAALKEVEARFAAADERVATAEDALHAAYADREATRRERYAARRAHERAAAMPLCTSMRRNRFAHVF